MKTLEQIITSYKSETIDGRDLTRLASFLPADKLEHFGMSLTEGVTAERWNAKVKPFTRENIIEQLKGDVEFGFENPIGDDTGSEEYYNENYVD